VTATRLDVALVARGLAESREKAQALVMAGRVSVDGARADKPGRAVKDAAAIQVAPGPEHVGRGALKLEGALDRFGLDPAGRVAIDVGASTGGFTEVLLARGAVRVYAVDVGRGQLHEKLRADPRVVVLEKTNARDLSPAVVPETCAMASVDVSFISVRKILAPLAAVLADGADAVVLVKPQFEVGRRQVGRGGLVTDPALHLQSLADAAADAQAVGYGVAGAGPSPITGTEGNREFFLHLVRRGLPLERGAFDAMMEAAVKP
jgi:23S rRNA (cytidine1920-2'-O)/16S rRNA (cytidine1409-2'-O)-methyltransferase